MKSSMSMDLALFSLKSASCKTVSIFLLMLKSAGTSCEDGAQNLSWWHQLNELMLLKSDRSAVSKHSCYKEPHWLRVQRDWKTTNMTHHIVYGAVNPVVLFQQLFYRSGPGNYKSTWSSVFFHMLFWQNRLALGWQCLQQAGTHLKAALRVLFFLTKAILTRPSHSFFGRRKHVNLLQYLLFWPTAVLQH